jgi:hypothetical protein
VGKIRRGNFVFIWWIGDHGHHVHVYRDKREVVKWDLDNGSELEGHASKRLRKLISELQLEGAFGNEDPKR